MLRYALFCSFIVFATTVATDRENTSPLKEPKIGLQKEIGDISGYYDCKGRQSDGKRYNGVVIIRKVNEAYIVSWVIPGNPSFTGIGVRQNNHLAVGWAMQGEKKFIQGINFYKIEPGPRLVGRWASLPGMGVLQRETLIFLKAPDEDEN